MNIKVRTGLKRMWKQEIVTDFEVLYYVDFNLEQLRKSTHNVSHSSQSSGYDLKVDSPKYKAGVLASEPRWSEINVIESTKVK